jgi:tRNA (cmo5U34)-methyltransferase
MNEETSRDLVDETITAVEGGWEFTSEVAEHFDDHVQKSIPMYEQFQDMTVNISEWFVHDGSTVYDIGCSTGETIARLVKKHASKKNVQFIGIDTSEAMITQAQKKSSAQNVQFLHQDVTKTAFREADMVISLFTLQFLEMKERMRILQEIYDCLSIGGALVIGEKMLAEEGRFDELWTELYWDFKRGRGLTDDQILHKARSIRGVLRPLTVHENIKLLRTVGFTSIDIFIKWYNFAGILAIKTADTIDGEESACSSIGQDHG